MSTPAFTYPRPIDMQIEEMRGRVTVLEELAALQAREKELLWELGLDTSGGDDVLLEDAPLSNLVMSNCGCTDCRCKGQTFAGDIDELASQVLEDNEADVWVVQQGNPMTTGSVGFVPKITFRFRG